MQRVRVNMSRGKCWSSTTSPSIRWPWAVAQLDKPFIWRRKCARSTSVVSNSKHITKVTGINANTIIAARNKINSFTKTHLLHGGKTVLRRSIQQSRAPKNPTFQLDKGNVTFAESARRTADSQAKNTKSPLFTKALRVCGDPGLLARHPHAPPLLHPNTMS